MRHLASVALLVAVAACADVDHARTPTSVELQVTASHAGHASGHFVAPASGGQEVPAVETRARGNAVFHLSEDGTALHYRLVVAGVENATQSHIHLGPAGSNGPVVAFLFGFVAGGVTQNGVLAEGTITQANLIARPAIGFGGTMPELLAAMRGGGAYVNVHTVERPAGLVRGQVREAGPTR